MKKSIVLFVLMVACVAGFAQLQTAPQWTRVLSDQPETFRTQLISSSEYSIKVNVQVPGFYTTNVTTPRGEAKVITMPKAVSTAQAGEPNVPMTGIPAIIGDQARMGIRVVDAQYMDFEGIEVAPSKGDFPRTIDPASVPYTYGACYSQDAFFPANNVGLYEPYIIRDFRGQNMVVYPFAYNPVSKTLRVYYNMTVEMYKVDNNGSNVMETRRSNTIKMDPDFKSMYQRHFINYQAAMNRYTALDEEGDLLIICYDNFISSMTDFVNWKKTRGINTTIVGTSTAGSTYSAIKTYIQNQYNANNNLTHVLLVGDVAQIPGYSYSGGGSSYGGKGDNAYGQIVGSDIYNDVFIGRFSASTAARVTTQCNRVITYERDLTTSATWLQVGEGISRKEGGSGHNSEDDYQHMNNIRTDLLNYGYTPVYQRYANLSGYDGSSSTISSDINSGVGIINYTNHGQETAWGANQSGYIYYSVSHVNALTNENKLPFIWSVACLVGKYDHSSDCFAEAWMNATNNNNPTGAIGTLMSYISQPWIPPMWAQDECVDILVESYSSNIKHTWGGTSVNGLMGIFDHYSTSSSEAVGTYQAWILYGDPSLMLRTKTPTSMNVTHVGTISPSATSYSVTVSNGSGALATITDANHNILGRATVSGTTANINISGTLTAGTELTLCVFGYNKVTYIGTITVQGGTQYTIGATANPTAGGTVSGAGQYYENTQCTLTATPNTGYEFTNWTKNGTQVSNNATYSFNVTSSANYVANFNAVQQYTITATASPTAGGTVTGSGAYNSGATCTLTATANTGYTFTKWTKNGTQVSTNATYSFTVTGDATYIAVFTANTYTISATASPTAGGTISGAGTYTHGSTCTLTATPATGYTFTKWTKNGTAVSTNASYSFTVTATASYVAVFTLNSYDVTATANPTEGGTVTVGSSRGNRDDLVYDFEDGTSQGWTTLQGTNGTSTHNWMHVIEYVRPEYANNDYGHNSSDGWMLSESYLSGTSSGSGYGVYPDNYLVSPQVRLGGSINFWATNGNEDYGEEHFSVEVSTTNNTNVNSFTMVQEWTLLSSKASRTGGTRTFTNGTWYEYTVDLSSFSGMGYIAFHHFDCYDQWILGLDDITIVEGEDNSTSSGNFNHGESCTVTATPNTGYNFVNWTENGTAVSSSASYTFTVISNRDLVANFSQGQPSYTVTATANPTNGGTVSGGGTFEQGQSCTLTATASTGYTFTNWTKNGTQVSTNATYTFTVSESADYVANFTLISYAITATANPTAGGTITGAGSYNYGATATLVASANAGYVFVNWTKDGAVVSTEPSITFNVTAGASYMANFEVVASHSVTVNQSEGGTITANPTTAYVGDVVTLTATANSGYYFSAWDVRDANNNSITVTNNQFTMPNSDVTVNATFVQGCTVTIVEVEHGTVTASALNGVPGTTITLTATPETGYFLSTWIVYQTGDVRNTITVTGNSFVLPAFDVTVVGIFKMTQEAEIAIGSGSSNSQYLPTYTYYKYSLTQQIYTASEIGQAGTITAIAFKVSNSKSSTRNLDVYLKHTSKTVFTSKTAWESVSSGDKVFSGSVTFLSSGWTTITLNTPFEYDGTSNLVVCVDDNTGSYDSYGSYPYFYVYSTGANRALSIYSDGTNYTATSPSSYSGTYVTSNNQITFTMNVAGESGSLTVSPNVLSDFTYIEGEGPSAVKSLAVIGTDITDDIIVTAPDHFEVSDELNGDYGSTLTLSAESRGNRTVQTWDFEGSFENWTTIDADGDGYNWALGSVLMASYSHAGYSGDDMLCSESYHKDETNGSTILTPDNWLISPQVTLGGTFSMWAKAQDASYPSEHFGIYVSTTSNINVSTFTKLGEWTLTAKGSGSKGGASRDGSRATGEWYEFTVDLSAYAGQTGYIAVRHFDCTDMFYLDVDYFTLNIDDTPVNPDPTVELLTANVYVRLKAGLSQGSYANETLSVASGDITSNVTLNGTVTQPAQMEQTVTLVQGVNWWSTYLNITLDDLKTALVAALGTDGTVTVKSQNGYIKYENGMWMPATMAFDIRQMYMIQVSNTCEMTLTGVPVNPSNQEITIHNGVNWIGFLSSESMTVTAAFAGLNPVDGDAIKGKMGSATYNGTIWMGSLQNLEPGQGYIYQSKASGNKTFTYGLNAK